VQSSVADDITNRVLLSLSRDSWNRLRPALEVCTLAQGDVINRADRQIEHLYFINRGLVSIIKTMRDGQAVGVGTIGVEGVCNVHAVFGINEPFLETVVQIPGTAFRIEVGICRRLIATDDSVREVLKNYVHYSVATIAQTAACNGLHHVEERCCRWLLIAHDSARADTFSLTHESLAATLGVQRAGISVTAKALQEAGTIRYRYGRVTIIDRLALEDAACECYAASKSLLRKMFPRSGIRGDGTMHLRKE